MAGAARIRGAHSPAVRANVLLGLPQQVLGHVLDLLLQMLYRPVETVHFALQLLDFGSKCLVTLLPQRLLAGNAAA